MLFNSLNFLKAKTSLHLSTATEQFYMKMQYCHLRKIQAIAAGTENQRTEIEAITSK